MVDATSFRTLLLPFVAFTISLMYHVPCDNVQNDKNKNEKKKKFNLKTNIFTALKCVFTITNQRAVQQTTKQRSQHQK